MIQRIAKSLRAFSVTAMMVCLALVLAGVSARAEPGLWVAKGPQATIYLFGTIHVLRPNQNWRTPAIANALAASEELWLELPDPGNAQEAQALMAQLGFDREHPLSSKLTSSDLARLDAAAKAIGMAGGETALEPMRPWLAAVALEDGIIARAGYDPGSGVEQLLLRDAVAAGKSIHGFETMGQQMRFFADMSPALEREMLENTLQDFDQGPAKLDALIDAWLKGDDEAITRSMVDEVKKPFPALYRVLLVDRNEAWADAIVAMLKRPGTRFIAVGAAHLSGSESVQTALERRGIHVARIGSQH